MTAHFHNYLTNVNQQQYHYHYYDGEPVDHRFAHLLQLHGAWSASNTYDYYYYYYYYYCCDGEPALVRWGACCGRKLSGFGSVFYRCVPPTTTLSLQCVS